MAIFVMDKYTLASLNEAWIAWEITTCGGSCMHIESNQHSPVQDQQLTLFSEFLVCISFRKKNTRQIQFSQHSSAHWLTLPWQIVASMVFSYPYVVRNFQSSWTMHNATSKNLWQPIHQISQTSSILFLHATLFQSLLFWLTNSTQVAFSSSLGPLYTLICKVLKLRGP